MSKRATHMGEWLPDFGDGDGDTPICRESGFVITSRGNVPGNPLYFKTTRVVAEVTCRNCMRETARRAALTLGMKPPEKVFNPYRFRKKS